MSHFTHLIQVNDLVNRNLLRFSATILSFVPLPIPGKCLAPHRFRAMCPTQDIWHKTCGTVFDLQLQVVYLSCRTCSEVACVYGFQTLVDVRFHFHATPSPAFYNAFTFHSSKAKIAHCDSKNPMAMLCLLPWADFSAKYHIQISLKISFIIHNKALVEPRIRRLMASGWYL